MKTKTMFYATAATLAASLASFNASAAGCEGLPNQAQLKAALTLAVNTETSGLDM